MSSASRIVGTGPGGPQGVGTLKLYQVVAELEAIEAELIECNGEASPELIERLDAMEGSLPDRAEAYAAVIQRLTRSGEAAQAESRRLYDLGKARINAAARMKSYLKSVLERLNLSRLETDRFRLSIAKNARPSIAWGGEWSELPREFRRTKVELDGDKALQALKDGALPEGFFVEQGTHLRIS
jgi:hypothetical protein